jgi:hypothetical protein
MAGKKLGRHDATFLQKYGKQKQAQGVLTAVNKEAAKTDHSAQAASHEKETKPH